MASNNVSVDSIEEPSIIKSLKFCSLEDDICESNNTQTLKIFKLLNQKTETLKHIMKVIEDKIEEMNLTSNSVNENDKINEIFERKSQFELKIKWLENELNYYEAAAKTLENMFEETIKMKKEMLKFIESIESVDGVEIENELAGNDKIQLYESAPYNCYSENPSSEECEAKKSSNALSPRKRYYQHNNDYYYENEEFDEWRRDPDESSGDKWSPTRWFRGDDDDDYDAFYNEDASPYDNDWFDNDDGDDDC